MSKENGTTPATFASLKIAVSDSTKKINEVKVEVREGDAPSTSHAISDPLSQMSFLELDSKIKIWQQELDDAELLFIHQSQTINRTDEILRKEQEQLVQLNRMLQHAHAMAGTVDQEYEFINCQLDALSNFTAWLEKQHTNALGPFSNYKPPDNSGRAALYSLVYQMYHEKSQATDVLYQVLGKAQELSEGTRGEMQQARDMEVFQIVSILNVHMTTLQHIDRNLHAVIAEIERVKKYARMLQDALKGNIY